MRNSAVKLEPGTGPWASRYESCSSEDELLGALAEAISSGASGLATNLQPRWCRGWTWSVMRRFWPEAHARLWTTHLQLLSESIVYVSRQLREFLSSSAFHDAHYVYREAALGAGGVMAARMRLDDLSAEDFGRTLSHVLLQHAHFPPDDDDSPSASGSNSVFSSSAIFDRGSSRCQGVLRSGVISRASTPCAPSEESCNSRSQARASIRVGRKPRVSAVGVNVWRMSNVVAKPSIAIMLA